MNQLSPNLFPEPVISIGALTCFAGGTFLHSGHPARYIDVAQVSKPAVSPISKSAGRGRHLRRCSMRLRVWKPAIQQVWKPALQLWPRPCASS